MVQKDREYEQCSEIKDKNEEYEDRQGKALRKTVLVTGATGCLGH